MSAGADPQPRTVTRAERGCTVALASLEGIGPGILTACAREVGVEEAWDALQRGCGAQVAVLAAADARARAPRNGTPGRPLIPRLEAAAAGLDAEAVLRRHETAGQSILIHGEAGYPARLARDPAPPQVLFALGSLDPLDGPTVAIVGTRNATRTGCETAAWLAAGLVGCGVAVVSGLALGIDGAAHRAALDHGGPDGSARGRPVGVVATGLDLVYPRRHHLLHQQVAARGVLLSETPLGGPPVRWRFPARNRIIAGLSDAVVVVESRSAGGSMLTAAEALARDVTVLAVPGHPTAAASAGPLDLLADGAVPVRDVEDVLVAIGLGGRSKAGGGPGPERDGGGTAPPHRSTEAAAVLDVLGPVPRSLGDLALATSLDLDRLSGALIELERQGSVVRSGAWFERTSARERAGRKGSRR